MSIALEHWQYRSPSSEGCLVVGLASIAAGGLSRNKSSEQSQKQPLAQTSLCVQPVWVQFGSRLGLNSWMVECKLLENLRQPGASKNKS